MRESKPAENIEQRYDDVINYIDGYHCFIDKFGWRRVKFILRLGYRDPKKCNELVEQTAARHKLNPLSGKNFEVARMVVNECATDEEKNNDYYRIATSDYPLHELSVSAENKFPDLDFEKIKKLHELRKHQLPKLDIKRVLGVVFAAATIFLKSIPESVVKKVFVYEEYEFWVTVIASGTIAYLALLFLFVWYQNNRVKKVYESAALHLEYTALRLEENKG